MPATQVRLGRFDHQVKMIRHEAIGMNLPAPARLAHGLDKPLPVAVVVVEDRFAPIPTVHDFLGTRPLGTESEVCAPYRVAESSPTHQRSSRNWQIAGTDP